MRATRSLLSTQLLLISFIYINTSVICFFLPWYHRERHAFHTFLQVRSDKGKGVNESSQSKEESSQPEKISKLHLNGYKGSKDNKRENNLREGEFCTRNLPIHTSVQKPAGVLCAEGWCVEDGSTHRLHHEGQSRKKVLILCTGDTLTMADDPSQGGSLAPV